MAVLLAKTDSRIDQSSKRVCGEDSAKRPGDLLHLAFSFRELIFGLTSAFHSLFHDG